MPAPLMTARRLRPHRIRPRAGVALLAVLGSLALAACSGAAADAPGASAASTAAASSPTPTTGASTSAPSSPGGATTLPAGEDPYSVESLTADGTAVTGLDMTQPVRLSPEADSFSFALLPVCSQLHVDVAEVGDDAWQTAPSAMQPAVGCTGGAGEAAADAARRLFDGEVAVDQDDDGTLTLTRDGVELVLVPQD